MLDDIPMGPVPPDFTLEQFVGRQLNQVCIGPFDLQFRFDSTFVISCQGQVAIEIGGRSVVVFLRDDPWWADVTPLPRLAGRDCVSWRVDGSHEFSVTLSGDAHLRFQSTDCPYEEFVIHPDLQVV